MSAALFFLGLLDLNKLCCVVVTLQEDDGEEPRSRQMGTCRELVLSYSDVLASPALDSFADITVVTAIPFFRTGILQLFGERRRLQLGPPQPVSPGLLQCCLSYSLITRLAPSWNKAGLYLVAGRDFLSESGRLDAVRMEWSTTDGQLCFSLTASTVRLPPTTLEDFDIPPLVQSRFCSDPTCVLDPSPTGRSVWCHVLPSMKKGQIITISRLLPPDGPFRSYRDLQNHWNCLYGYRLPDLPEEQVVYCSVYFRLLGGKLFTYPLSCIRLQPVQHCPLVDVQGVLGSFLSDISEKLQSVCGFPARLTRRPQHTSLEFNTAAVVQVLSGEQVNLVPFSSSSCCSSTMLLTQCPPPRPMMPLSCSQPSSPSCSQLRAQGLLGNGCGFSCTLTLNHECGGGEDRPPSSSSPSISSRGSLSFTDPLGYHTAPSLASSSSFSSSCFLPVFQPTSSLISTSSSPSSSSTVLPPTPKVVPFFQTKCPSRHVSVALLQHQKLKEQLRGGGEEVGRRVTLPSFGKEAPAAASSSSSVPSTSAASFSVRPPPFVPRFDRHPKPSLPTGPPNMKLLPRFGPKSQSRINPAPKLEIQFKSKTYPKPILKHRPGGKSSADCRDQVKGQPSAGSPLNTSHDSASKVSEPRKSRSALRHVDVEIMARSNQLWKLSSASLAAWLRGRGALGSAKHRKEELILKVMSCLAEA